MDIQEPNIVYYYSVSPNPTSENITIKFFLTTYQAHFSIKIYKAIINHMETVTESCMTSGDKQVVWESTSES